MLALKNVETLRMTKTIMKYKYYVRVRKQNLKVNLPKY